MGTAASLDYTVRLRYKLDVLVKRRLKLKSRNLFLSLIFQTNGGEGPPVYYNIKLAETRNK